MILTMIYPWIFQMNFLIKVNLILKNIKTKNKYLLKTTVNITKSRFLIKIKI